jgi:hypothetical protein
MDRISLLLLNGNSKIINEVGNYIMKEEGDMVSYLPKSRYNKEFNDPFSDGIGRTKIRIGRFVNKFLKKSSFIDYQLSPVEIEMFVNLYKSCFKRDDVKLEVVTGNEVKKWYLEENYKHCNCGTLWNSCMRQKDRNKFMELYAVNDSIKMVIMVIDGKLVGRALLWDDVVDGFGNKMKFMDRIYTNYTHDVNIFKKWATENGYNHKVLQNSKSEMGVALTNINSNPTNVNIALYVKLENHKLEYYPYLDTFKFYDPNTGTFSNNDEFRFKYMLVQSNGSLVPPDPTFGEEEEFADDDQWYIEVPN